MSAQPATFKAGAGGLAHRRWLRPLLVFFAAFAFAWWFLLVRASGSIENTPDFSIFYAAGTPGPVYDARWIGDLVKTPGVRLFAYPPPFLLICRPLALLPFGWAYGLWVAGSATLFVEATGELVDRGAWLVLLNPMVLLSAALGQTPLFIGGLVILGMTRLHQPLLAGALFGIAFSIKPQVLLLLPVALALTANWRALVAMGLAGLGACLVSLLLGPQLWWQWIASLHDFQAAQKALEVVELGAPAPYLPFCLIGAVIWLWITRNADTPTRSMGILAGSFLVSPHASAYEMAQLAPPAFAILCAREVRSIAMLPMLLFRFTSPLGMALCAVAAGLPVLRPRLPLGIEKQA